MGIRIKRGFTDKVIFKSYLKENWYILMGTNGSKGIPKGMC